VELDQIGQIRIEHAFERFAQRRMIAPDREHPVSAQEVEIFASLAVEQILSGAAAESNIVSDRAQDPHHLLVEMARMSLISVCFVLRIEVRDIGALERAIARVDQVGPMAQWFSSYLRNSAAVEMPPETTAKAPVRYKLDNNGRRGIMRSIPAIWAATFLLTGFAA